MKKLMRRIKSICTREEGASAVEYGLLVALIAAVIVGAVTFLGGSVSNTFNTVATTVNSGT
ncbi:MAG: Flp family type IVb pilin [Candidatus Brocadiales bacterium]